MVKRSSDTDKYHIKRPSFASLSKISSASKDSSEISPRSNRKTVKRKSKKKL